MNHMSIDAVKWKFNDIATFLRNEPKDVPQWIEILEKMIDVSANVINRNLQQPHHCYAYDYPKRPGRAKPLCLLAFKQIEFSFLGHTRASECNICTFSSRHLTHIEMNLVISWPGSYYTLWHVLRGKFLKLPKTPRLLLYSGGVRFFEISSNSYQFVTLCI